MSKFKKGQKVKCVNPVGYLIKDMEYTVKSIYNSGESITVEECVPTKGFGCYKGMRFEPVILDIQLSPSDISFLLKTSLESFSLAGDMKGVDKVCSITMDISHQINNY